MQRLTKLFGMSIAGLVIGTGAGMAEPKLYPVQSVENFCPSGLQPVTSNGAICCGVPNQDMTYDQAMAYSTSKRATVTKAHAASDCPAGTKGCS